MNVTKTKYLCAGRNEKDNNLNDNINIELYEHYRYFRIDIKREDRDSQEIKSSLLRKKYCWNY